MRKSMAIVAIACVIGLTEGARADRIHLPCDADLGVSVGSGIFNGKTSSSRYGDIGFNRIQPAFLRLEGTVFGNCTEEDRDDGDGDGAIERGPKVSRRWFGRLNLYAALTLETTSLEFRDEPRLKFTEEGEPVWRTDGDGNPLLDEAGNPVQATMNRLLAADLATGMDWSGGIGARLSVYDHPHFHLEVFGEYTSTFGWNPATADDAVVRVLESDLDITRQLKDLATLRYRWSMAHVGLTVAVPLRPNTVNRNRVTPFVSLGRMRFRADVDLNLDPSIVPSLEALSVNVESITEARRIEKESWLGFLGARLDFNRRFSIEAAAAFWKSDTTTVYWLSGAGTLRFDVPWK